MATLASDWWSLFLCNYQTEFNWKKHPQSLWSLYFSGRSLSAFVSFKIEVLMCRIFALWTFCFFCSWSLSAGIPIPKPGSQVHNFGPFGLLLSKPKEITTFIPYFIIQCKLLFSIAKSHKCYHKIFRYMSFVKLGKFLESLDFASNLPSCTSCGRQILQIFVSDALHSLEINNKLFYNS